MKLLYYSTAYHAPHGGSIQSKLFFQEAQKHPLIESIWLFPECKPTHQPAMNSGSRLRKFLKSISLLQVFFFFRRNHFYLKELFDFIDLNKPDAILIQLDSSFLQIRYLKKRYPHLIVATVVNSSPFDEPFRNIAFKKHFRSLEQKTLALSDVNFFVSSYLAAAIMNNQFLASRDLIVHNGVNIEMFKKKKCKTELRAKFDLPLNKLLIGYIGTLDEHKKVDNLLHAFAKLREEKKEVYLIILGNGPMLESLKQLAVYLQIVDSILFTGWIEHTLVPEYLNCFDMAVHHHANHYMSPLKLFEYLSVGVPVIGPDIPAVKEILQDNVHLLLTTGTNDDLLLKLKYFIDKPEEAEKIAAAGSSYVIANYTWHNHADIILRSLTKSLNKQAPN